MNGEVSIELERVVWKYWDKNHAVFPGVYDMNRATVQYLIDGIPFGCCDELVSELRHIHDKILKHSGSNWDKKVLDYWKKHTQLPPETMAWTRDLLEELHGHPEFPTELNQAIKDRMYVVSW